MAVLFDLLLTLLILPIALLVVIFAIEVLAAVLPTPKREHEDSPGTRPSIAILVPAHNEERKLLATLESVKSQLWTVDHLLVVADNCADDTAGIAADFGAEVIERHDLERRGKGYALDFGIRHLERYRPDVVIVIDADCLVDPGCIDRLVIACADSGRPVQALYAMYAPEGAGLKLRIAEFAWLVKNRVRALGLRKLGLPCQLMGTGMAFPWAIISKAKVASGNIVEDMELGLSLAQQGVPPMFCPGAKVSSIFPTSSDGVNSQRTRWEHGHLGMIIQQAPRPFCFRIEVPQSGADGVGTGYVCSPFGFAAADGFGGRRYEWCLLVIVWCRCIGLSGWICHCYPFLFCIVGLGAVCSGCNLVA
ncbi:MAG: glycosyltransferase family 2 protein [Candidatus Sedimenticola sp. (ex Thyasira tokunagai)]